jgi:hypothetical protein
MNKKFLALLIIAVLPLMAFDCITDFSSVNVSLNLAPITEPFPLNPGSGTTYAGSTPTIDLASLFLYEGYTLTGETLQDITVGTKGEDLGNGSGTVSITVNSVKTTLFTYNGAWTAFNTPQSLITSSLITRNQPGVDALIAAVTARQRVVLSVSGIIAKPPQTSNTDFITVSVYVQASGHK